MRQEQDQQLEDLRRRHRDQVRAWRGAGAYTLPTQGGKSWVLIQELWGRVWHLQEGDLNPGYVYPSGYLCSFVF